MQALTTADREELMVYLCTCDKNDSAANLHLLPKGALRDVVRYFIPMSKSEETRECEQPLEKAVSQVIGEMPFLWLAVGDKKGPASLHGYPLMARSSLRPREAQAS